MYKQLFIIIFFGCVVAAGCNSTKSFTRGDQYMHDGRYEEAIIFYDKGLKHSDNYQALLNKGIAQWRIKQYSNAKQTFSDAINVYPENSPLAYYYRAELEFKTGNISESLRNVNKSIKQYPLNVHSLNLRGRIYILQGRYKPAVEDFSAALAIEGESSVSGFLQHNRAVAYIGMDNFDSARTDYEQFIRFLRKNNLPITVEDNYLLGVLQYASGKQDEALASWKNMPLEEKARIKQIVENSNPMFQF
ncbi:MAG: tetratricopeptide repeat protein [Candidatus Scalinduaceae bacterium]